MLKKPSLYLSLLAGLLLSFSASFACDEHGKSGIVEENSLWIGADQKNDDLTKEVFFQVINDLKELYAPIIAERGATLVVEPNWESGTVNAYAQQIGNTWKVMMFGGLARHHTITPDAFAVVMCHELGHHIGGAPKKRGWNSTSWATNEGQADYWGTTKCLKRYMERDNNVAIVSKLDVPEYATKKCQEAYSNSEDVAMCQRTALAGLSLGNLFRALRRMDTQLKFSTPDPSVVSSTYHGHPQPQCRLDTYFQGGLCNLSYDDTVDDQDPNVGVCNRYNEDQLGLRPLCWYLPSESTPPEDDKLSAL